MKTRSLRHSSHIAHIDICINLEGKDYSLSLFSLPLTSRDIFSLCCIMIIRAIIVSMLECCIEKSKYEYGMTAMTLAIEARLTYRDMAAMEIQTMATRAINPIAGRAARAPM